MPDIDSDRPGSEALLPLLVKRTPLNHARVPFILCWSHKAGCTAAVKWFLHHAGLLDEALNFDDPSLRLKIHSYENKVLKARPGYLSDLLAAIGHDKPLYGFMRCPYERVFSSYMILNHEWYLRMTKRGVSSPGIKTRREVLASIYGSGDDLNRPVSFRDYLLWLQQQDFNKLNPHHTLQGTALYQRVAVSLYRLEDFDVAVNHLEQVFGLDQSWSARERFSSGHHRPKTDLPRGDALAFLEQGLPLDQFPLEPLPRVSRQLLEGTQFDELIKAIMAEDIARYDSILPLGATAR